MSSCELCTCNARQTWKRFLKKRRKEFDRWVEEDEGHGDRLVQTKSDWKKTKTLE